MLARVHTLLTRAEDKAPLEGDPSVAAGDWMQGPDPLACRFVYLLYY